MSFLRVPGQVSSSQPAVKAGNSPEKESVQARVRHHWQQLFDQTEVRFAEGNVDLAMN